MKKAAEDGGFDIGKCQIIDPEQYDEMDAMVDEMVTLRKGKMTADEVREALKQIELLRHYAGEDGQG